MITPADILAARRRLAGVVAATPIEHSRPLSAHCGADAFLKLECAQLTGSFKLRGAANALLARPGGELVTCSAGNHALGVAHAAGAAGLAATIVLPETASPAKVAALGRYPVRLVRHGATYDEAEAEARRLERAEGLRFLSPYNDPDVIAGQGTVAVEMLEQLPAAEVLLVAVGGGGLIGGVALWAKAVNPAIRVVGVQAANSAAMIAALHAGQIVPAPDLPTLADGLSGGIEAGSITFPLAQRLVDEMVAVSEEQIAAAMRWLLDEHHLVVEGSGAVGVAALLYDLVPSITGRRVVALLSGRNVATSTLRQIGAV